MRILVADDDVTSLVLVNEILRKLGCDATVVEDGYEAASWFAAPDGAQFDLILMDLMMPRMDGYAATAAIRSIEEERGGRVPIVAMTAGTPGEDYEDCRRIGMDGFLKKPIDLEQLEAVIYQPSWPEALNDVRQEPVMEGAFQSEAFCQRCNSDRELMLELVSTYLQMSNELLRRIRSGAAALEFVALREASHKLCSATGNLCAEGALRALQRVEDLARRHISRGLSDAVKAMDGEMRSLSAELLAFKKHLTAE